MTLIRLCFVLFTWGLEIKITTDTDHVLVFVFQFCFVLFCVVLFFLVIRTSIFQVKPGLFLFSGLFQPGNVLSYASNFFSFMQEITLYFLRQNKLGFILT